MKIHRLIMAALATILISVAAFAMDLQQAKSAGWVGEQIDGYVGLVRGDAPPEVRQLVNSVNDQRRQHYRRIASEQGIEVRQVELLAAEKAIEKTPAGQHVQNTSGSWVRK